MKKAVYLEQVQNYLWINIFSKLTREIEMKWTAIKKMLPKVWRKEIPEALPGEQKLFQTPYINRKVLKQS